jgi:cyclophilin family peptidyl-prolyl cis-trans isomerase
MKTAAIESTPTFSPTIYNQLLDVNKADQLLWAREGQKAFFDKAGALICRHNLEDNIGLCLLHNHNEVEDDHMMVEIYDADTYPTPALVMAHVPDGKTVQKVPVAMQVRAGKLIPLEHSTVPSAVENFIALEKAGSTFTDAFCEVVTHQGFQDLVGLAVLRTGALGGDPGEEYYERIDPVRVANVLRIQDTDIDPNIRFVQTSWKFSQDGTGSATKCKPDTHCEAQPNPDDPHLEYKDHEISSATNCTPDTHCEAQPNPDDPHLEYKDHLIEGKRAIT